MNFQALFTGRLNRRNFILAILLKIAFLIGWVFLAYILAQDYGWSDENPLQVLILNAFTLLIWAFGFSIALRRCNDLNFNRIVGILVSLFIGSPIFFGGIFLIFLGFSKGSEHGNRYGEIDSGTFLDSVFALNGGSRVSNF